MFLCRLRYPGMQTGTTIPKLDRLWGLDIGWFLGSILSQREVKMQAIKFAYGKCGLRKFWPSTQQLLMQTNQVRMELVLWLAGQLVGRLIQEFVWFQCLCRRLVTFRWEYRFQNLLDQAVESLLGVLRRLCKCKRVFNRLCLKLASNRTRKIFLHVLGFEEHLSAEV